LERKFLCQFYFTKSIFPQRRYLSNNSSSWGREHNSEILMKKPLLFSSSIIENTCLCGWSFQSPIQTEATFSYGDIQLSDNKTFLSKIRRVSIPSLMNIMIFLMVLLGGYQANAQCVNFGTAPTQDYDCDGIINNVDLDDDNDGILDSVEELCISPLNSVLPTSTGAVATYAGGLTGNYKLVSGATLAYPSQTILTKTVTGFQINPTSEYEVVYNKPITNVDYVFTDIDQTEITDFYVYDKNNVLIEDVTSYITLTGANVVSTSSPIGISLRFTAANNPVTITDPIGFLRLVITQPISRIVIKRATQAVNLNLVFFTLNACIVEDTDGDGIANNLDLDSDGDGCSDAIEGGGSFTPTNLVASSMAGGNSGVGYTGTSTAPVVSNLGNTVNTTVSSASYGVPTIATTGQGLGDSQNGAVSSQCTTCNATIAPTLSATTATNICPSTIAFLNLITASNLPSGTTLSWHAGTPATAANEINPDVLGSAATYYAAFKGLNGATVCFGPTTPVTVTATTCAGPLTITQPPAITKAPSTLVSGTAPTDVIPTGGTGAITYSNGSADPACVQPVGATALPTSIMINSTTGAYSYTTPSAVGTYYFCVKVCDSTSPTPTCAFATYKVTVTVVCNAGTVAPGVN
jgi:hypothetical protein